ncbi:MAG: serine hydrolase [Bacteroidetes bacterium]|nr:serine hydrolase [Bacteroidota bacterium]
MTSLARTLCFIIFSFGLLLSSFGQRYHFQTNSWVDSVYNALTPEQRIAQLIMAAAYSNPNQDNEGELNELISQYQIGGVIFFKGSPERQLEMLNRLQDISPVPLLVGIDAEWGLNMRLDSTIKYPRQMALAAFDDDSLIYEMGREIGRQCKRLGIHINFAPVADINNNPNNPVINDRSFGENKYVVSRKALMYMKGLQDEGIIACVKHYPGHGDTETDSHLDLPVIRFPYKRLDTLELYPFRYLIDSGAMSIMTAHLYVTTLDPKPQQASSLSYRIVRGKLIDSMGFDGLIITDALNMKGVSKYIESGKLEVKALQAGNDILLFPEDVPAAIQQIKLALDSCEIDSIEFEYSVKKVLAAKYKVGLNHYQAPEINHLYLDLNNGHALSILDEASARQLTLVRKKKRAIPLARNKKIACVAIGTESWNAFHQSMNAYGQYDYYGILRDAKPLAFEQLKAYLKQEDYDQIIVSLHNTNRLKTRNYGLSEAGIQLVNDLNEFSDVILVSFGIPYNLQYFEKIETILVSYQDINLNMAKAAQALHGVLPLEGKLSVTVSDKIPYRTGISMPGDSSLLRYTLPESAGMKTEDFVRIDSAIDYALKEDVFPGCQVLVAKGGQVVYAKNFGYFDYSHKQSIQSNTVYDIASVTKVAATTLAVMHLVDRGKLDIQKKASYYLKELRKTNKADITIKQLLSHTAGLQSWIPFYMRTIDSLEYPTYYSSCRSESFPVEVAHDIFGAEYLPDSIWHWILESPVDKPNHYKYSDLGFMMLQKIVEEISHESLDEYVDEHIYGPLNLGNTSFRPLEHFALNRIAPTENDTVFRKQVVRGYVHDPASAMLGGVAGHAGLFSNSQDLAVILQMLLNGGSYGDVRILKPETVQLFTGYCDTKICRRGYGFDKPETDPNKGTPCSRCCSPMSFGHSGFTGTYIWVDPDYQLIYIFLSNRVHPDASNSKISKMNVRTNIQDMLYEFIDVNCLKSAP